MWIPPVTSSTNVPWPYSMWPYAWGLAQARFPDEPECDGPCQFVWVPSCEMYMCTQCNYRVRCLPELRSSPPVRRTGPLYAVRAWLVVRSPEDKAEPVRLRSVYLSVYWPVQDWLVAEHDWEYGKTGPVDHQDRFDADCTCGIHAFKPGKWRPQTSGCVWGIVSLAGRVLVCEGGYRAERGRVEALCFTSPFTHPQPRPEDVAAAAAAYKVPAYHRGRVMLADFGLELKADFQWRGDPQGDPTP